MADVAISGLTALGAAPATNDLLVTVDVDDTTQAPTGTTKKMTVANLFTAPAISAPVISSGMTVTGTSALAAVTATEVAPSAQVRFTANTALSVPGTIGRQVATGLTLWSITGATNDFHVYDASGSTAVISVPTGTTTVKIAGDFAISTSKFTVAASTGNTVVAGTLGVTSDFAIATNKFTVAAASGNTVVAGTLGVTGALTAGSLSTGGSIISSAANAQIGTTVAFGGFGASYGWLNCQTTASVSSVATAISPNTSFAKGGMAMVYGSDGTNKFADLVFYGTTGTPTTVAAQTIAASPTARTYSMASNTLKLAMASGTYTIETTEMYKGT